MQVSEVEYGPEETIFDDSFCHDNMNFSFYCIIKGKVSLIKKIE